MIKLISLSPSSKPTFKYAVRLQVDGNEKTIHFGARGYEDFTVHRDPVRKRSYLARHKRREDWSNPLTRGFWSRWLLWNQPSLSGSLEDVKKRFSLG